MNIITIRRISQIFFKALFLWFCVAATLGEQWHQLRGWPVNWFLELDPLVGLGTFLSTGTLYRGLAWCLAVIVLTLFLGRFFCGWVCPFGALHQFVGWLGKLKKKNVEKIRLNQYRKAQHLKYWLLIFLLFAAGTAAMDHVLAAFSRGAVSFGHVFPWFAAILVMVLLIGAAARQGAGITSAYATFGVMAAACILLLGIARMGGIFAATLQTGLLDPIPLLHRSVNLVVLPFLDKTRLITSTNARYYEQAWTIGIIFIIAVSMNLLIPRFYCRFVCPLGALFGLFSRHAVWRMGQRRDGCTGCKLCDADCEGACAPSGIIKIHECVLCMNCLHRCPDDLIGYDVAPSLGGETVTPDLARRELLVAALSGAALGPVLRLGGHAGPNWNSALIRPPGALDEAAFLTRCIKCGQCMRVCPTNIIQPAIASAGVDGIWTPRLNFRIGTSGCQLNCIACGNVCPTAAIRPLELDEKLGRKDYAARGPVRIGTAFVDRNRCLPWTMKKPCIVCQENCPVSPKAIYTGVVFEAVRLPDTLRIDSAGPTLLKLTNGLLISGKFATGDYYVAAGSADTRTCRRITENQTDMIRIDDKHPWDRLPESGSEVHIYVRLQRPLVDPETCIGCGTCEHECPVSGKRAIRVSAENESRNTTHKLLL